MRLGELGGKCDLGERLRATLLPSGSHRVTGEADAAMIYPGGGPPLLLHRVVLAARAPRWLAVLEAGARHAEGGDEDAPLDVCDGETDERQHTRDGVTRTVDMDGTRGEDSRTAWRLADAEAAALPRAACALLYELVVCGHATLPHATLRPKALLAAADRLGLKQLLLAPPTDDRGRPWLARHLGALAGSRAAHVARVADVRFELAGGVRLSAHSCLLGAGSEYFATLLSYSHRRHATRAADTADTALKGNGGGRASPHVVRIDDAGVAAWTVLLRYVYSDELPSAAEPSDLRLGKPTQRPLTGAQPLTTTGPAPAAARISSEAEVAEAAGTSGGGDIRLSLEAAALWRRLEEHVEQTQSWLHCRQAEAHAGLADAPSPTFDELETSELTPSQTARGRRAPRGLAARDALELSIHSRRYMLEPLAEAAHRVLGRALSADAAQSATEVVPLLLRAERECEHVASEVIFQWAVDHYELVHSQLDLWLHCAPSALPAVPRLLGEEALRALEETLRAAMLRRRHGL